MKKIVPLKTALLLICFSILLVSCTINNQLVSNANPDGFIDAYNAFHNNYYKNNHIKSVTSISESNTTIKKVYHYNTFGDLYKFETFNIDENGNEILNEISSNTYQLVYENNTLKQISYDESALLTHSTIEYESGLIQKISDYRNDELYYFTNYTYNNNSLTYTKHTRLNSVGVRFGTSPVTFEYNYFYNDNGNLLNTEVSYQGGAYELGEPYEYNEDSNLPNKIGDLILTYTYFQ